MVELKEEKIGQKDPAKIDHNYKLFMKEVMNDDRFPFSNMKLMNEIGGYNLYELYQEATKAQNAEKKLEEFRVFCDGLYKKMIKKKLIDPESIWGK